FLWMMTHDTYMVRTYWLRESTDLEKRIQSECQHCGKIDSTEHILTQCEIPGQKVIAALAKERWTKRNPDWPWPGLGAVISVGPAVFKDDNSKTRAGEARLYCIMMFESAYLIWKM
ncbi:hypothetical protein B0H11DRAFT_1749626, partial [Mycena galericulata]